MAGGTRRRGRGTVAARRRVGLAVVIAALRDEERRAIETAWRAAIAVRSAWQPAFKIHTVESLQAATADRADLLVYLGESSRFEQVAGAFAARRPVVLVKSTVERLLLHDPGTPPRYRVCTSVDGIARALAEAAPPHPTVDWTRLRWPAGLGDVVRLGELEQSYVEASLAAFRRAARDRGIRWRSRPPADRGPFSVFLTMHDPLASRLAAAALALWPQCTVLTADGMVSGRAPDGTPWPPRVFRVRHWSPRARSRSNRLFRDAIGGGALPDFDTAGLLFGTLAWLDHAFGRTVEPDALDRAPAGPGPLGPMRLGADGRPRPERVLVGPDL